VDVHVRWETAAHVDMLGSDMKLVSTCGERADEAVGDQPVSVRPMVG
jgi:hypothetical protein